MTDKINLKVPPFHLRDAFNAVVAESHGRAVAAGWWGASPGSKYHYRDQVQDGTRLGIAIVNEKIALIHSEISEAMEGFRKDAMDDKLEHRKQIEVELADAVIRIADLAGALQLDVGGAIVDKMMFNAQRKDHQPEARAAESGKRF